MTSEDIKSLISRNATEIERLHSRIHETFKLRDHSAESMAEWHRACAEFNARYDALAFPGGYVAALNGGIVSGDPYAMEAAICFLECRPYFFRSGYNFNMILRRCKRAPLPKDLADRLQAVIARVAEWKQRSQKP